MSSTNERTTMLGKVKDRIAEAISNVLILQAEHGIKHSAVPTVSEPNFLVELMKEDAS